MKCECVRGHAGASTCSSACELTGSGRGLPACDDSADCLHSLESSSLACPRMRRSCPRLSSWSSLGSRSALLSLDGDRVLPAAGGSRRRDHGHLSGARAILGPAPDAEAPSCPASGGTGWGGAGSGASGAIMPTNQVSSNQGGHFRDYRLSDRPRPAVKLTIGEPAHRVLRQSTEIVY